MWCCKSLWAPSVVGLRPVLGVDADVLRAEVARPHGGGVRAAGAEVHEDLDLPALEYRRRLLGSIVVRDAVDEQLHRANRDRRVTQVERSAGTASRRDEPAPVRIPAVDRGLDQ